MADISTLMREPLLHLLLGGSLIFLALGSAEDEPAQAESAEHSGTQGLAATARNTTIVVDEALRSRLRRTFQSRFGKNPSPNDLETLVQRHIDEEVLYRAGLQRGLAADDAVVRQRVVQKMRLALNAAAGAEPPTDEAIAQFYRANAARYETPATMTFQHVLLGESEEADTAKTLAGLRSGAIIAAKVGKPFSKGQSFRKHTDAKVDTVFGPGFAAKLRSVPVKSWAGPLGSTYGQHLVWVESVEPARPEPLRVVRRRVVADLEAERSRVEVSPLTTLRKRFNVERR